MLKTVKIKPSDKSQGEFVLINADDFDNDLHELYVEIPVDPALSPNVPDKKGKKNE